MLAHSSYLARIIAGLCLAGLSVSAFSADVTKGEKLSHARKALLAKGWEPRETFGVDADGARWSQFADAGDLYRAGMVEVESCSGTGANYCTFNYRRKSECLSLQTEGEFKAGAYEPTVVRATAKCPSAEAIGTAAAPSRVK